MFLVKLPRIIFPSGRAVARVLGSSKRVVESWLSALGLVLVSPSTVSQPRAHHGRSVFLLGLKATHDDKNEEIGVCVCV